MLGYFPAAYPDELFYSICARFSDKMQYPKKYAVVQELFGTERALAIVDLPNHLKNFINILPPGHHYTIDSLIDYHTLLPFYRLFLKRTLQERVRDCMQKDTYNAIQPLIGNNTHHILYALGYLRFCLQCVEADRQIFGECYWHRVHQLSCVRICPIHRTLLLESGVRASGSIYECEFISAEKAVQEKCLSLSIPEAFYQNFLRIALDASWLLDHPQFNYDSDCLKTQYYTILFNQGLATYGKQLRREKLLRRFYDCYTQDFLRFIHCEPEVNVQGNWLYRAIHPGGPEKHPLQHLLLIHFMGYEAETFFRLPIKWKPFGDGPWPCLNPASDHYKHYRVFDCRWYRGTGTERGKPTGIFSCECGFVYLRKGPDMTPDDDFRLSRVKVYGPVWEATLRQLWYDPTIAFVEIARRLQVVQTTVVGEASRIGLSSPRPGGKKPRKLPPRSAQRKTSQKRYSQEECRQSWLQLMTENPEAGVNTLKKNLSGVHDWLRKHDLEWLNTHKPPSQRRAPPPRPIDWQSRDKEIAEAVKASAHRLKNTNNYPMRLTATAIGRNIGHQKTFARHLDKLPLTEQALSEILESRENFIIRRTTWIARNYQEKHI